MARELLADPFLPNKVAAGQEDKIVLCLRCFTCMAERPVTGTRRCAVNPLIGREIEGMEVTPALRPRKARPSIWATRACGSAITQGWMSKI